MKKIVFFLATYCPALTEIDVKILSFETHWNAFVMTWAGCKDIHVPVSPENCSFSRSSFNYSEWKEARESAKKLFKLKDATGSE